MIKTLLSLLILFKFYCMVSKVFSINLSNFSTILHNKFRHLPESFNSFDFKKLYRTNKMTYQFTEILKFPLSDEFGDKFVELNIQRGVRVTKRAKYGSTSSGCENQYAWHLGELRLYVNKKKSCGISMSANEFDWLTAYIGQAEDGTIPNTYTDGTRNRKAQKYHCSILKQQYCEPEILISTVSDQGRVFSIVLTKAEMDKLLSYAEQILFILKANEYNSGPKLFKLVEDIFFSHVLDLVEMNLQAKCVGCEGAHASHAFLLDAEGEDRDQVLMAIIDNVLNDFDADKEFTYQLYKFFDVMKVDLEEREYVLDKLLVDLKADKKAIMGYLGAELGQSSAVNNHASNFLAFISIYKTIF